MNASNTRHLLRLCERLEEGAISAPVLLQLCRLLGAVLLLQLRLHVPVHEVWVQWQVNQPAAVHKDLYFCRLRSGQLESSHTPSLARCDGCTLESTDKKTCARHECCALPREASRPKPP